MSRFSGEIAFDALAVAAEAPGIRTHGETRSIAMPGVTLHWRADRADVAFRDGILVVAAGRARDGVDEADGEAARWLDRLARRGNAAVEDVGGGFSVVIVDTGARQALLAVDRFGIEPLCYRHAGSSLAFADSACDVPRSAHAIRPQSLFDYLYFHVIPAPGTIYQGVTRLDAAHRLIASTAGVHATKYWKPQFIEDDPGDLRARSRRFVEAVGHAVEEEADDAATACFLSGGTDSSTVAGMLTRVRGAPAHAYSIGFDSAGYDEMAYARIAARHFGLSHDEHYVTPNDVADAMPVLAASFDQPFGNSSVLPAYLCAARARKDGFTRVLAGDGGDELYGGNARYAMQKAFELYHSLPAGLRARALEPLAMSATWRRMPLLRQAGGYVRHSRAPMPDRLNAFNLVDFIGIDEMLEPEFRARIDAGEPLRRQRDVWASCNARSIVNRMLEYDWKFTLADSDLPKVRAATQLAGIGVGYPFLAREVADFSLRVPPQWKVRRFTLRWFFKHALRDFLPREILRKKKHGFGLPFGAWVLQNARLRALVDDALHGIAERGIVRPRLAGDLVAERLQKAPAFYGELVWILVMLELWLRTQERRSSVPASGIDGERQARVVASGRS